MSHFLVENHLANMYLNDSHIHFSLTNFWPRNAGHSCVGQTFCWSNVFWPNNVSDKCLPTKNTVLAKCFSTKRCVGQIDQTLCRPNVFRPKDAEPNNDSLLSPMTFLISGFTYFKLNCQQTIWKKIKTRVYTINFFGF